MGIKKVYFLDKIIPQITEQIANREPESGGLLMGPPDKDVIAHFQYDEWGSTSVVDYSPDSQKLSEIAQQINDDIGYAIKGVVHSHPEQLSSLSSGDLLTIQKYFEINPSMTYFIAPIVYRDVLDNLSPNILRLNGRHCNLMIAHVVYRDGLEKEKSLNEVTPVEVVSDFSAVPESYLPFGKTSLKHNQLFTKEVLEKYLREEVKDFKCSKFALDSKDIYSIQFQLQRKKQEIEVICLLPTQFPLIGPQICVEFASDKNINFPLAWDIESEESPGEQLGKNLQKALKETKLQKALKSRKKK